MRIGLFGGGWWKDACAACGFEGIPLPLANPTGGGPYRADFGARCGVGADVLAAAREAGVDLLLDNGATSLSFVDGDDEETLHLLHEKLRIQLITHFIDPVHVCLQGMRWPAVWHALQSQTWVKAIWDHAHASELQRFGVPNIVHLPMAAPDRQYNTRPLDAKRCRPVVSFVGGQSTRYFASGVQVHSSDLLPGALAQAVRADMRGSTFYDVYQDLYGLGGPPTFADAKLNFPTDAGAQVEKYLAAKLYYHAALSIANRDRFVLFLSRKLGSLFELTGRRWKEVHGLTAQPRLATADDYFDHFRQVAINLNLVSGNAETGLNMRHFEITAAGGFMLCYRQPELERWFRPGRECAVFEDEVDLLNKIAHYLAHPEERAEIAYAGQLRSLSEHLFSHRLRDLVSCVPPAQPRRTTGAETGRISTTQTVHVL